MKKEKTVYKTATVEAALGGWIVRIGNSPAQVFVRWERVVQILEENLTSKGNAQ